MSKSKTYYLASYAIMAAVLCILAPLSIPIGPVPISLTSLVLYFAIFILGTKGTLISFCVYLLIGLIGLPVFSGYAGGIGKLAGPTGGYLIGFIPLIIIMGIIYSKFGKPDRPANIAYTMIGMILATAVLYFFGTLWFVLQMQCTWLYALTICVFPFIAFDIIKMALANVVGRTIRKALLKQGLIKE